MEATYSLLTIVVSVPLLFYPDNTSCVLIINITNAVLFTMYALSLQTSMLISVDRYIAVRCSLRYHVVLPKDQLKKCLALMFLADLLVHLVLIILTKGKNVGVYRTSAALMFWFLTLRLLTCVVIVVTGIGAFKIRRQNINRLQSRVGAFGQQAEQLDALQVLKGSLKDVSVLNLWTIIFLVVLIGVGMVEVMFDANKFGAVIVLIIIAENFVNPFVTMTTQREIRNFIFSSCAGRASKAVGLVNECN